jgi:hypothetical protein
VGALKLLASLMSLETKRLVGWFPTNKNKQQNKRTCSLWRGPFPTLILVNIIDMTYFIVDICARETSNVERGIFQAKGWSAVWTFG